jgi:hypothetical protein
MNCADFNEEEEVQCQRCRRGVNLYYEEIFVINTVFEGIKTGQERWCKQCAVKGMKGEFNGR